MDTPDHIILVHNGALGDFLTAWPAILSLRRHFSQTPFYWAGRDAYRVWLHTLDIQKAPGVLQKAVDALYTATDWPTALDRSQVIWFGLRQSPCMLADTRLWFVRGIETNLWEPPSVLHARQLADRGIPWAADWRAHWQGAFGNRCPEHSAVRQAIRHAMLLPGAGHRAKQWPRTNFIRLADWLQQQGLDVTFMIGPAEVERGMRITEFPCCFPRTLSELQTHLQRANLVVGNDSGPMHLAGCLVLEGFVLFGPASELLRIPGYFKISSTMYLCTADAMIAFPRALVWASIGKR